MMKVTIGSCLLALALQVHAVTIPASVAGLVYDGGSSSLDGIGDTVVPLEPQFIANLTLFESRAIFEFDLASVLTGPITSASLRFGVGGPFFPHGPLYVDAYSGNGSLDVDDFAEIGSSVASGVNLPDTGVASLDVTAAVTNLISTGATFAGFILRAGNGQPSIFLNPNIQAPEILVDVQTTPIPEAATSVLAGAGLGLTALIRGMATRARK